MGISQSETAFTSSISFRKLRRTVSPDTLARGYLDDMLVISFGILDHSSHFIEVKVDEMLKNHEYCKDFT